MKTLYPLATPGRIKAQYVFSSDTLPVMPATCVAASVTTVHPRMAPMIAPIKGYKRRLLDVNDMARSPPTRKPATVKTIRMRGKLLRIRKFGIMVTSAGNAMVASRKRSTLYDPGRLKRLSAYAHNGLTMRAASTTAVQYTAVFQSDRRYRTRWSMAVRYARVKVNERISPLESTTSFQSVMGMG